MTTITNNDHDLIKNIATAEFIDSGKENIEKFMKISILINSLRGNAKNDMGENVTQNIKDYNNIIVKIGSNKPNTLNQEVKKTPPDSKQITYPLN